MFTKNFFFSNRFGYNVFSFAIVFIAALTIEIFAQNPCPNYSDLLDKGWATPPPPNDPHIPEKANRDEFATFNSEPFILNGK